MDDTITNLLAASHDIANYGRINAALAFFFQATKTVTSCWAHKPDAFYVGAEVVLERLLLRNYCPPCEPNLYGIFTEHHRTLAQGPSSGGIMARQRHMALAMYHATKAIPYPALEYAHDMFAGRIPEPRNDVH